MDSPTGMCHECWVHTYRDTAASLAGAVDDFVVDISDTLRLQYAQTKVVAQDATYNVKPNVRAARGVVYQSRARELSTDTNVLCEVPRQGSAVSTD